MDPNSLVVLIRCNDTGKDQLAAARLAMAIWSVLYTQGLKAHQEVRHFLALGLLQLV